MMQMLEIPITKTTQGPFKSDDCVRSSERCVQKDVC